MRRNGASIVIETLIEQGVTAVFGYPGGTVLNIYDELYKASERIHHYITCHEQGAAHAADGYARATGKTGVVIATSGPGATNLVTGIATAYLDSTPLVAITGNVAQALIGKDSFQEVDIKGVTMPITKHNFMVKDVSKLAETLREAFEIANSGRPGPVLVDIPKDVQMAETEFSPQAASTPQAPPPLDADAMAVAVSAIINAKRPFIYAGGGVIKSKASQALIELSEKIDAPIAASMMGLSAVPNDHPHFLGMSGMHGRYAASKALSQADVIIAVGTRFSDRATGNPAEYSKDRMFIHIDIDPAEIDKNIPAYHSVVGDVQQVLTQLNASIGKTERPEWKEAFSAIKKELKSCCGCENQRLSPKAVIKTVRRFMPDDGPVATDVGQHQMWVSQFYRFSSPATFVTSGGLGTMGFGLGAAIGACIGSGKRTTLFTSDGSFHMNLNELATAVTNNLPLVVVMLDNNALGMVRQWQTLFFDKRYSQTTLNRKTDYVKLAEAFGAQGIRIDRLEDLATGIEKAFSLQGPVVVDVKIDSDELVLPMIPAGKSIDDIILE